MYKILNRNVTDFCIEEDTVWVSTLTNGVFKIQVSPNEIKIDSIHQFYRGNIRSDLRSIAVDNDGVKWITSYFYGIFSFKGSTLKNYTTNEGLASNSTRSITIDNQNRKWIGTVDNGVSIYDNNQWTTIDFTPKKYEFVASIEIDSLNNKWISTKFGVYKFNHSILDTLQLDEYPYFPNETLLDSKGNLWFCGSSWGGITRFDGTKITTFKNPNEQKMYAPQNLVEDVEGNIWASTSDNFFIYHKGMWITLPYSDIKSFNFSSFFSENSFREPIWIVGNEGLYYIGEKKDIYETISPEDSIILNDTISESLEFSNYNWLPFNFNQIHYFTYEQDGDVLVEKFVMDSIANVNGRFRCLFNTNMGNCNNCYESYDSFRNTMVSNGFRNINEYSIGKENVIFKQNICSTDSKPVLFKPFAKLGDTWTTQYINFLCTTIKDTLIFGELDSIKIFTVSGGAIKNDKMILSKKHGLLYFPPIFNLISQQTYNPYQIVGYQNQNISKGYRPPSFQSYIHFTEGDYIFKKDLVSEGYKYWNGYNIYMDSIISVDRFQDSIVLVYKRKTIKSVDEGWTPPKSINGEFKTKYTRKAYENIAQNATSWPGRFDSTNRLFYNYPIKLEIIDGDTISKFRYISYSAKVDTILGDLPEEYYEYDFASNLFLSTKTGIYKEYGFGYSKEVIGYQINGKNYGKANEYVTNFDSPKYTNLYIYPNPVKNTLHIKYERINFSKIKIMNLNGIELLSCQGNRSIDVSKLKSGIYILEVIDSNGNTIKSKLQKE